MAFAERCYIVDESHVHARVYNILKARRGVDCGDGGGDREDGSGEGVRFCRASPRDKSSLCRARKWREQRKSEKERKRKTGEEEVHYIYLVDAYPVVHGFLNLYRGSLLREK